jgi:hypothetical protein
MSIRLRRYNMTVIRLDAATLEQFKTASGEVVLADQDGKPVRRLVLPPLSWTEPTEVELRAAENDPETYSFDEVLAHLKTLEQK